MAPTQGRPGAGRWYAAMAPGILVAATGVGAGDLITGSLAGARIGVALLWAALVGAALKWTLNEGLARWQLATGTTLLEGWVERMGGWIQWVFAAYLVAWSFFTGGALISACGVAGDGLLPLSESAKTSKIIWGVIHSALGVALVRLGGYRLFEKLMGGCVALMFVTVVLTAALLRPDWGDVGRGIVTPRIPARAEAVTWTLGLLGGVGGTLTLLSYGYWIREEGREGRAGLRACRLDLLVGYAMTALFGMAMVIIGSRLPADSADRSRLPVMLAELLAGELGPWSRWAFLAGFWGAVFSSLLGVWQSAPYLFADFVNLRRGVSPEHRAALNLSQTRAYQLYLYALACVPLVLLWLKLAQVQKAYAVLGAFFMPLLALSLLMMNNRVSWVGREYRNGQLVNAVLVATLAFFGYAGGRSVLEILTKGTAPAGGG
jgi:Mn2+/Fe2+ NRAMP family transporter